MKREGMTIREASQEWVNGFNAIPYSLIEKLIKLNPDDLHEITPPGCGDYVYIYSGEHDGEYGHIEGVSEADENKYTICLDKNEETVDLEEGDFEVQRDGWLPIWGTLWSFGECCDNYWLERKEGLQAIADCGFRIYEQEDLEYVFGIDGAGYDFYEQHWIPLYKARGLQWHNKKTEKQFA